MPDALGAELTPDPSHARLIVIVRQEFHILRKVAVIAVARGHGRTAF